MRFACSPDFGVLDYEAGVHVFVVGYLAKERERESRAPVTPPLPLNEGTVVSPAIP